MKNDEIMIDSVIYKISDLKQNKFNKRASKFYGLEMKYMRTSPKPIDELQLKKPINSTARIENRKEKIIENILKENNVSSSHSSSINKESNSDRTENKSLEKLEEIEENNINKSKFWQEKDKCLSSSYVSSSSESNDSSNSIKNLQCDKRKANISINKLDTYTHNNKIEAKSGSKSSSILGNDLKSNSDQDKSNEESKSANT